MSTSGPGRLPVGPTAAEDAAGRLAGEFRTLRAAAIAGIAFALTLTALVVLLHLAFPAGGDQGRWISDDSRRGQVGWALSLVPYAGIAFLWFIGVIRARLGELEDKLFATVFLGSGLLFIASLFTAAALLGGVLALYDAPGGVSTDEVRLISVTSSVLLATFSIRMAAVFTLVVTNLGRRTGIIPRWLQVIGYATALVLLVAPPRAFLAVLLFPAWVFLLSVEILIATARQDRATA